MLGIKQLLQINGDICPRQCYYRPKDFSVIYIIPPLTRPQILPWLRSKAQSQFFISEAFTTTFKLFHVSLVISHNIEKPSPLKSFIKMFSPPIFLEHDTEYPVLHSTMTEARVFFVILQQLNLSTSTRSKERTRFIAIIFPMPTVGRL